jgi:quercetin dioxygenase-like cupin family protein
MMLSRRDCCLVLSALAPALGMGAEETSLPSKAARFEDLPARKEGGNEFRPVLEGQTHAGCPLEVHETRLAPGSMPHPAHHHVHEEMFLVREGTIEATINGKSTRLGPGSVAFMASNDEHGIRNVGTTAAQYFVIAIGKDS